MADDERIRELENRIGKLEQQLPAGVTRRDVMKLAGAGGVGALLGGGGMASATEPASAGTAQSGQLGTAADPVDIEAEDVNAASVSTGRLSNTIVYASNQSGSDGGSMVQAALNELGSTPGTVIVDGEPDDLSGIVAAEESNGWLLSTPIQIPDNTVLDFRGTPYLFLEGGTNDNLIRNAAADSGDGTRNSHIYIEGPARLDGNEPNQTQQTDRYLNHGIHLYKVDRYLIENIDIGPTNAFAILTENVNNGHVENITFHQDASGDNQDGHSVIGPGVGNSGAHYRGTVGDDALAAKSDDGAEYIRGSGGDLYDTHFRDAVIENVDGGGILRTVSATGNTLDGVVLEDARLLNPGDTVVTLGWTQSSTTAGDHTNITLRNVGNRGTDPTSDAILLRQPVGTLTLDDCDIESVSPAIWNADNRLNQLIVQNSRFAMRGDNPAIDIRQSDTTLVSIDDATHFFAGVSSTSPAVRLNSGTSCDFLSVYGNVEEFDTGVFVDGTATVSDGKSYLLTKNVTTTYSVPSSVDTDA